MNPVKNKPLFLLAPAILALALPVSASSSGDSDPITFGIILTLAGLGLFASGFGQLRKRQLIENTPTSKIRSLAMGPAEVAGRSVPRTLFKSWLSSQDCMYCHVMVEEEHRSKNSTYWVKVFDKASTERFFIEDETGKVMVDPTGAELDLKQSYFEVSGFGKIFNQATTDFMSSNGVKEKALFNFMNRKMRVTEWVIQPGIPLYVLGVAGDNPEVEEGTAVEGYKDIMIQAQQGQKYMISDKSEKEVLKGLNWKFTLILGIILFAIGLLIVLWRLNVK